MCTFTRRISRGTRLRRDSSRSDLWYPSMTPEDYARYMVKRYGTVRANLVQPTWYGLDHTYIIDCIARALRGNTSGRASCPR